MGIISCHDPNTELFFPSKCDQKYSRKFLVSSPKSLLESVENLPLDRRRVSLRDKEIPQDFDNFQIVKFLAAKVGGPNWTGLQFYRFAKLNRRYGKVKKICQPFQALPRDEYFAHNAR